MSAMFFIVFLAGAAACAAIGSWVDGMRQRGTEGAILGLLLGPIGILIAVLLPVGASDIDPRLVPTVVRARPPEPRAAPHDPGFVRIRRAGLELDAVPTDTIPARIADGRLTRTDQFFDTECSDWITLDLHPALLPHRSHL